MTLAASKSKPCLQHLNITGKCITSPHYKLSVGGSGSSSNSLYNQERKLFYFFLVLGWFPLWPHDSYQ